MHECTGVAASWCPIHGDCTCPDRADPTEGRDMNSETCPLHSSDSTHAEPVTVMDDARRGRWPAAGL